MVMSPYGDLGAHIDGFIAVVAHTLVVGASLERKVTGKKANVVLAAYLASQAALRLLKPGNEVIISLTFSLNFSNSNDERKHRRLNYNENSVTCTTN